MTRREKAAIILLLDEIPMLTAWLNDTRYPGECRADWDSAILRVLCLFEANELPASLFGEGRGQIHPFPSGLSVSAKGKLDGAQASGPGNRSGGELHNGN